MTRQPYTPRPLPNARAMVALAEAHEQFRARRSHGLTALNYTHVTGEPEQFDYPFSEFRGLIVDEAADTVVARPFQKFWHAGQKAAEPTDWDEPHVILPKLDGSLVYPARHRLVTKGGVTDTSLRAEKLAQTIGRPFRMLLQHLRTDPEDGAACTPLFEYIGSENTIVLQYGASRLVLLAVRRIGDGLYWSHDKMTRGFAAAAAKTGPETRLGIVEPITDLEPGAGAAGRRGHAGYAAGLVDEVAAWPGDREGIVVAFAESGHRLKIKSREYVALHRARDDYSLETRVLRCWADGNAEKLLTNLSDRRAGRLRAYYRAVEAHIAQNAREIAAEAAWIHAEAGGDRKTAALAWITATAARKPIRGLGFAAFNAVERGAPPVDAVAAEIRRTIGQKCNSRTRVDTEIRPMLGTGFPTWSPTDGSGQDIDA